MKNTLIQKVGIDRSVITNFTISGFNPRLLRKQIRSLDSVGAPAYNISVLEGDPSVIPGEKIRKVCIKDKKFGQLTVKSKRDHHTQQDSFNSELQLSSSNDGNNLRNLTAEEYRQRIASVVRHFKNVYGISMNFSDVKISMLEINSTIQLKEEFSEYANVLQLFMALLPEKIYGNNPILTWQARKTMKPETLLVKNSGTELKIYDKNKQLRDARLIFLPGNFMRIEYSFSRLQNSPLKNPDKITDQLISDQFLRFFKRDIVKPYESWKQKHQAELLLLLQEHMRQTQYWLDPFFRDCRQRNVTQNLPALFDLNIMEQVLSEIFAGDKNKSRKIKSLRKKFIYEADLAGNADRADEIIQKVLACSSPR